MRVILLLLCACQVLVVGIPVNVDNRYVDEKGRALCEALRRAIVKSDDMFLASNYADCMLLAVCAESEELREGPALEV